MQIPFIKQPGVDKRSHRPYNLVVFMDDAIKNRWLMTEQAVLQCTCEDFRSNRDCRHVKEKSNEFLRWKRATLQRLRAELCEGLSLPAFADTLSNRLGIPLEMARFVIDVNGEVAVQLDHCADQGQGALCNWGTMGAAVYTACDPTEAGALCLLTQELDCEIWDPIESVAEVFAAAPKLPPSLFKGNIGEKLSKKESALYYGQSGVVSLVDNQKELSQGAESGDDWAAYWARLCGLDLVGSGWSGEGRYLPGWKLEGYPVGGLAFDLVNYRMTGIPADALEAYSEGVPTERRQQLGHVHLPWDEEPSLGMVLVRHPTRDCLSKDDDVVLLTTNLWQDLRMPESAIVRDLIAITAAYLVRMGHNPRATILHGSWANQIGHLAEMAEDELVDQSTFRWKISEEGIFVLREHLVPAVLNGASHPETKESFGVDWNLFLPPE